MIWVLNLGSRSSTQKCFESACCICRVVRGLLLAVGRPDGRLCSQTKNESWVVLGLQQVSLFLVVQSPQAARLQ